MYKRQALQQPGGNQKLEFLLYKEYNFTTPYRDLHLWVNVSAIKSIGSKESPSSAGVALEVVSWYAKQAGLDPNNTEQYAEAEKSLKDKMSGGYWKIIARGDPLTEKAGNCQEEFCLVRGVGACTECRAEEMRLKPTPINVGKRR